MTPTSRGPTAEFVALAASLTALVALAIDAMLPAVGTIAADLGATSPNSRQYVLFALFAGLGVGQLFYGPLSDRIGRKPAILVGLAIFAIGTVLCLFAPDFRWLIVGRVIEGFGAAGPRIVSTAMVRDRQSGAAMARTMSLIMSIFILVPIVAPALGQLALLFASWRALFWGLLVIAVVLGAWTWLRQPETLPRERRASVGMGALAQAARAVVSNRVTAGYTLATGLIFGALMAYLGSAQQVFGEQYGKGAMFPLYFGVLAAAIGLASVVNARLVMRYGMRALTRLAVRFYVGLTLAFLALCVLGDGHPPLWLFMGYMFPAFFCKGILFGNFNALAMEPMGRQAGMAASIIGTATSIVSIVCGGLIGQQYDGTLLPLVIGFAAIGVSVMTVIELTEARRPAAAGA